MNMHFSTLPPETVENRYLTYLDFCTSARFLDTASQQEEPRFDPGKEGKLVRYKKSD
jgi:hypothetical protein